MLFYKYILNLFFCKFLQIALIKYHHIFEKKTGKLKKILIYPNKQKSHFKYY